MKFNPAPRKRSDFEIKIRTRLLSTTVEFNHKHNRIQAELISALKIAGYEVQKTKNVLTINSPYLASEIYEQLATKVNRESISLKRW